MKQYVFGYGSLMETASRLSTVPTAEIVTPVRLNGMVRGWWARTKVIGFSTTYVGCLAAGDPLLLDTVATTGWTNGVLFEVTEGDLRKLDDREKNYQRTLINPQQIKPYSSDHAMTPYYAAGAQIWVYLNMFSGKADFEDSLATKQFPIVQSYVDICLNGCLELETEAPGFLVDFIRATWGWKGAWANDRIFPRRPHVYQKNAFLIDKMLKEHLPDPTVFDEIYIE